MKILANLDFTILLVSATHSDAPIISRGLAILLLILICAGLLGGLTSFLLEFSSQSKIPKIINFGKHLGLGLTASLMVPLFLNTISSDLVARALSDKQPESLASLLVILGFCLLAAVSSRRFIQTMKDSIISKLDNVQATADQALKTAEAVDSRTEPLVMEVEPDVPLGSNSPSMSTNEPETRPESSLADKNEALSDLERKALTCILQGDYPIRRTAGIAEELKISINTAKSLLQGLADKGYLLYSRGRNGVYWKLSPAYRSPVSFKSEQ